MKKRRNENGKIGSGSGLIPDGGKSLLSLHLGSDLYIQPAKGRIIGSLKNHVFNAALSYSPLRLSLGLAECRGRCVFINRKVPAESLLKKRKALCALRNPLRALW